MGKQELRLETTEGVLFKETSLGGNRLFFA